MFNNAVKEGGRQFYQTLGGFKFLPNSLVLAKFGLKIFHTFFTFFKGVGDGWQGDKG